MQCSERVVEEGEEKEKREGKDEVEEEEEEGGRRGDRKGRKLSAWKRVERAGLLDGNKRDG